MKLTREIVLRKWSQEWATLKAWNRDLSEVDVEISDKTFPMRLGTCWSHEQRLVIYRGNSIAAELNVLIHEFAHAATIGESHGPVWQAMYADAVREATGLPIPRCGANYRIVHAAGEDAVKTWWTRSGNEFLWGLCQ